MHALLAAAAAAVALASLQDPAPTRPTAQEAPRTEYLGREIARTMHWMAADWLTREERESEERTSRLLDKLGLEPGQTVVDFGCGNGYLALAIAPRLQPQGKVVGVDIQREMLALFEERALEADIANFELVHCSATEPGLAPASADLIVMLDVYHELDRPETVLAAARRALKPGGRIAFVEFRTEDRAVPIKPEHKMSVAQLACELGQNGLTITAEYDGLPWQHLVLAEAAGPEDELPTDALARSRAAGVEVARALERALRAGRERKLAYLLDEALGTRKARLAIGERLVALRVDKSVGEGALRHVANGRLRLWFALQEGDLIVHFAREASGRWRASRVVWPQSGE